MSFITFLFGVSFLFNFSLLFNSGNYLWMSNTKFKPINNTSVLFFVTSSHWRCFYGRGDLRLIAGLPWERLWWEQFLWNDGHSGASFCKGCSPPRMFIGGSMSSFRAPLTWECLQLEFLILLQLISYISESWSSA